MPLFERLVIETQANCNRECWFCPRTFDDSGVYRDASGRSNVARMPSETVLDLLDQAQDLGFIVVGLYDYETAEALEEDRAWWRARLPGAADLRFSYERPVHFDQDGVAARRAGCRPEPRGGVRSGAPVHQA